MPFHWIESVLALSFAAVWTFIGLTLLGDRLGEIRRRRVGPREPHYLGIRSGKSSARRESATSG